jgi:hypothetical protein
VNFLPYYQRKRQRVKSFCGLVGKRDIRIVQLKKERKINFKKEGWSL